MLDEKLIKRADQIKPYFYHLKSHPKAYNIFNQKHEKLCADIYVNLVEYFQEWYCEFDQEFESVKLRPDRQSVFNGLPAMWEIDRATMVHRKIISKAEKYLRYSRKYNRQFRVIFACSGRRARNLITTLQQFRNPNVWFYTVDYNELFKSPSAPIFYSVTGERVALLPPLDSQETSTTQEITSDLKEPTN